MNADEFIKELQDDVEENKGSFIRNMDDVAVVDHSFCEWIEIFSAWMEWTTDQCINVYGEG